MGALGVVIQTRPEWRVVAAIAGVAVVGLVGLSLSLRSPVGRWVRLSDRPDGRHLPVGIALMSAAILLAFTFVPPR